MVKTAKVLPAGCIKKCLKSIGESLKMNRLEEIYSSFCNAFEMVIDIPLPEKLRREGEENPFLTAMFIPVVGIAAGILLSAAGVICTSGAAGSLIWAFAAAAFIELSDSGRAGMFTSERAARMIYKESAPTFVPVLLMGISIFKLAALFLISFAGKCGYMVPFFTAVFTVEMYLAVYGGKNPVLTVEEEDRKGLWIAPALVFFIFFWSYPYAVLFTAAASAAVVMLFRKRMRTDYPVTGDDITCVAGAVQLLLLLIAIILL